MAEYFFELLLEEIPAWMHDAAHATLQQQFTQATGIAPVGGSSSKHRYGAGRSHSGIAEEMPQRQIA